MDLQYNGCGRFEEFAALEFNLEGNDLVTLLKYEGKYLKKPLLNLKPSIKHKALIANKLIVDFMILASKEELERHSEGMISELDIQQVSCLVGLGCCNRSEDRELRDEIYCQIVKQTTSNLSSSSCCRGFLLFLSCLAAFPPSQLLTPFLYAHFHTGFLATAHMSRQIMNLAHNCIRALEKIKEYGPRRQGITRNEIIAIMSRDECLSIKVWVLKDFATEIKIDSWTTMEDLKYAVCDRAGIVDTSTLTISAVITSKNESKMESKKSLIASSKCIMHALFDLLFAEMQDSSQHAVQSKWLLPCGKMEDIDAASKAVLVLNSFLKVDRATGVDSPDLFTTSHSCLTNDDFYSEKVLESSGPITRFFCLPFLCPQSVKNDTTLMDISSIDLKLKLRIWVFCDDDFEMSPARSAVSENEDRLNNLTVTIESQRTAMRELIRPLSCSKDSVRIDNNFERDISDAMRNILYNQLVNDLVDGSLMCSHDIETLHLAALALGELNQSHRWSCQERPFFIEETNETEKYDVLRRILPDRLINMPLHKRQEAGAHISEELQVLIADTERRINTTDLDSPLGYGIGGHNTSYSEFSSGVLKGLQERLGWVAFLYSCVVCLWSLNFADITSSECRDLYLRSVRSCTGYGLTVFLPSAVTVHILKESETREIAKEQKRGEGEDDIEGDKEVAVKYDINCSSFRDKPRCIMIMNEYKSHTKSTSLLRMQQEGAVPLSSSFLTKITIMLSVSVEGLILTESIEPLSRLRDSTCNLVTPISENDRIDQENRDVTITNVLLKVGFNNVISWGYNDELIVIKFRMQNRRQDSRCRNNEEFKEDPVLQGRNEEDSEKPFRSLFDDIITCAYVEEKDEANQKGDNSISESCIICENKPSFRVERLICNSLRDCKGRSEKERKISMNARESQQCEEKDGKGGGRIRGGTIWKHQRHSSTVSFEGIGTASNETKDEKEDVTFSSIAYGDSQKEAERNQQQSGEPEKYAKVKGIDNKTGGKKRNQGRLEERQKEKSKNLEGKDFGESMRCDSITLTTYEGIEIAELLQLYVSQFDLMKRNNKLNEKK